LEGVDRSAADGVHLSHVWGAQTPGGAKGRDAVEWVVGLACHWSRGCVPRCQGMLPLIQISLLLAATTLADERTSQVSLFFKIFLRLSAFLPF